MEYILNGFGAHGSWTLSNSTWTTLFSLDDLRTGNGVSGGYGERTVTTINNDWRFLISASTSSTPLAIRSLDQQFFLQGDANPIIFRQSYDDPNGYTKFSIIYDSDIKASKTIDEDITNWTGEIYRQGAFYYFTSYNLAFNYGSVKKPTKLKLATADNSYSTYWYNLQWYYTVQDNDFCFIF